MESRDPDGDADGDAITNRSTTDSLPNLEITENIVPAGDPAQDDTDTVVLNIENAVVENENLVSENVDLNDCDELEISKQKLNVGTGSVGDEAEKMEGVIEGDALVEGDTSVGGVTSVEETILPVEGETEEANIPTANDEESVSQTVSQEYCYWKYELCSNFSPKYLVGTSRQEFQSCGNDKKSAKFLKGCKWLVLLVVSTINNEKAPDGSCLLSTSDDDNLRLFNFPNCFSSVQDWHDNDCLPVTNSEEWNSALKVKEGGLIYDFCWYPLMSSMDPVSSCFLSTSSEAPIHLWDAFTGTLRASYQPFNHLEQLVAAKSLAFDPTGETIYSGYEKCVRIFNITRPGKQCTERPLKQPHAELNQYGIVASICVNPTLRSFYAVGSFDKTVGLYYDDGSVICLLQGQAGGVTHLKFSSDGMKLFSGGRNDSRLICWDMRKMGEAYKIFDRVVTTHQRIYFDSTPDDRYLISGSTNGTVMIWDVLGEGTEPLCVFKANNDCVNGVSCNPYIPVLATSSGQRHYFDIASDSDEDDFFVKSESSRDRTCDIKLWKLA